MSQIKIKPTISGYKSSKPKNKFKSYKSTEQKPKAPAKVVLFNKPFDVHADASDHQLGAVISQEGKSIAFHSRKLNSAQQNHPAGQKNF